MPMTLAAQYPTSGPPWFDVFFILCLIGIVIGIMFRVLRAARRYGVYRNAGLSPMTHDAQIQAKIAQAGFMAQPKSVEQRLAELDDLCRRGVISDSERAQARLKVLAEG